MKKIFSLALLFLITLTLSGCVGDLQELICVLMGDDADHCYQGAAVQEGDDDECLKIKGEGFKGSNPPRDKCYLMIAENTGDFSSCDKIKGGPMSYTREECIINAANVHENPVGCQLLAGAAKNECVANFRAKIDPYKVMEVDSEIKNVRDYLKNGSDADLEKQLKGLEERRTAMIGVLTEANKKEYEKLSDPINQAIIGDFAVGDIDSATKEKMIALNENLKKQGVKLGEDQYEAIKDYLKFVNDPKNNIENMDDAEIVKNRWNEKVGNMVDAIKIWKTNPTAQEAAYDEQLRFYERMLERQAAISAGQSELQQDFDRNVGLVAGGLGNMAQDKAQDYVLEQLLGKAGGTAVGLTTKVVQEALDTVKGEAKSMEFRGLVRAYNLGMADELGRFGGDVDKAHAEVIKKMTANPYEYEDSHTFAQYGNILENKDCDGTNPHCVNKDVFWKAMKKSYKYQHKN